MFAIFILAPMTGAVLFVAILSKYFASRIDARRIQAASAAPARIDKISVAERLTYGTGALVLTGLSIMLYFENVSSIVAVPTGKSPCLDLIVLALWIAAALLVLAVEYLIKKTVGATLMSSLAVRGSVVLMSGLLIFVASCTLVFTIFVYLDMMDSSLYSSCYEIMY